MGGLLPSFREIARELSRSRFRNRCKLATWLASRGERNLPRTHFGLLDASLQFRPQPPLFFPIEGLSDRAYIVLDNHVAAALPAREEQKLLLNVWSEIQQGHDLRHPGSRDVAELGEFGLVGDDAVADQLITADCQGHQLGDARNATHRHVRRAAVTELLATVVPASDVKLASDLEWFVHAASSFWLASSWVSDLMPQG